MKWIREKYKQWCEETKRNGSVLVGGSMYEFFDWIEKQQPKIITEEWISVEDSTKPEKGERIEVFSPQYKTGDSMRHRIIDEQFLSISTDASHWRKLSEPSI